MVEGRREPQQQQITDLKIALADAISAWSHIEDALCLLLSEILHRHRAHAPAIYFAPTSTETRFAIVDRSLRIYAKDLSFSAEMLISWGLIQRKLGKVKRVRNKLAHGAVVTYAKGRVNLPRLTGPFSDWTSNHWTPHPPGLSVADVRSAEKNFRFCDGCISRMADVIERSGAGKDDALTSRRKCRELAEDLRIEAARSGARTQPTHRGPPEPSDP